MQKWKGPLIEYENINPALTTISLVPVKIIMSHS